MRRTQIYLGETQTSQLDARARASGRTRSQLIRDAVADYLGRESRSEAELARHQQAAILAAFGAEPDLAESVAELREANRRRAHELEQRWTASS